VHLPPHPVWFWLILGTPLLIWVALWAAARNPRVSLKPLMPWVTAGFFVFGIPYFLFDVIQADGHKALRLVSGAGFWTCFLISPWIRSRYLFERLPSPNAKWYSRSASAEFSIPSPSMRILVRDIDSVSPWYVEKLGLRRLAEAPPGDPNAAFFRFKADGHSVILTTRTGFQTGKTPILFTKKIGRIKKVLTE